MIEQDEKVEVGDTVKTTVQMYFVEARHPETEEWIEVSFPRGHYLTVCGVNEKEETVDVSLPDGYVATLSQDDVEKM